MDETRTQSGRTPSDHLHPLVYKALIFLAVWLILAVWGFSYSGYSGLVLTVVTLFLLVAVGLPLILWRISRRNRDAGLDGGQRGSLSTWLRGGVEIWQGQLKGSDAAMQVVLPLAAAAVCMTALALVLHFDLGA